MSELWKECIKRQAWSTREMVQLRPPLHFGSIELDLGMNNENEENPYVCSEIGCGQAFKSSRDLINHRVNHVVVENAQGWICPFESCAQGDFADLIDANIHMYRTHNEDIEAAQCRIDRAKKLDEVTDNYNDNSDVEGVWKADSLGRVIYTTRVSFYQNVSNFSVGDIKYGFHTAAGVYVCHECRIVPSCLIIHLHKVHKAPLECPINCGVFLTGSNRVDASGIPQICKTNLINASNSGQFELSKYAIQGYKCAEQHCSYSHIYMGCIKAHAYYVHGRPHDIKFKSAVVLPLMTDEVFVAYAIGETN